MVSFDPGGALNETIEAITDAIPKTTKIIRLSTAENSNNENIIRLKIPPGKLIHENARTRSYKGSWESPWTRDYIPEIVKLQDGTIRSVMFQYGYPNSAEVGKYFATQFSGIADVKEVPYFVEGGNLVVDEDGNLFISERAIINNIWMGKAKVAPELISYFAEVTTSLPWAMKREPPEVATLKANMTKVLKEALDAKTLTWLPALNFEKGFQKDSTGHLDIYMKYLGEKRMLVGEIKILEGVSTQIKKQLSAQKKQLDEVAALLEKRGYAVTRLPFSVELPQGFLKLFSYTNSLIIGKIALVPSYGNRPNDLFGSSQQLEPSDSKIHKAILASDLAAGQIYKELGFKVKKIYAYPAWSYGGQIHCLTKQIPQLAGLKLKQDNSQKK